MTFCVLPFPSLFSFYLLPSLVIFSPLRSPHATVLSPVPASSGVYSLIRFLDEGRTVTVSPSAGISSLLAVQRQDGMIRLLGWIKEAPGRFFTADLRFLLLAAGRKFRHLPYATVIKPVSH
ncbi:hypothetical protein L798_03877 [Zootermopsis nevadensis]|uniref:Secreted protein n=1 Tax=Zootermopsis nevadensis TaxID=136037 RepID=A0A067RK14_ZOONE|nr:hypothetical protein L798_03877 [Zootermopsis nevadensis]